MNRTIQCVDCKEEFTWTEREQEFFAQKGFDAPKRCRDCRLKKKQNRMLQEDRAPGF